MPQACICIYGEVLHDHFPDGNKVLGGAPFNVAWHLHAFGLEPCFISRVGDDAEGHSIRHAMHRWGMTTRGLQTDDERPTGRVEVSFDDGEPSYDIAERCAYDAISADEIDVECCFLYHGSLALRESTSQRTLEHLIDEKPGTVFVDINLRPPFWQSSQIRSMLRGANWVKLNSDELDTLDPSKEDIATRAKALMQEHDLDGIVITNGSRGAEALSAEGEYARSVPGASLEVVDTVGAGDAFASVFIMGLIKSWPLKTTLERAQEFASLIVEQQGATISDSSIYKRCRDSWT